MKRIAFCMLCIVTVALTSCGDVLKTYALKKPEDYKVIVQKFKDEFKDRHEVSHLSFNSKDKMTSDMGNVSYDFIDAGTKKQMHQIYNFKEKKFMDATENRIPDKNITTFKLSDVNFDIIPEAYANARKQIIEKEKMDSNANFALVSVLFFTSGSSDIKTEMTLQTGTGNREYYEYNVKVGKDGSLKITNI